MVFVDLSCGGDETLEGRVIVYAQLRNISGKNIEITWYGSHLKVPVDETHFLGRYVTIHPLDFSTQKERESGEAEKKANRLEEVARKQFEDDNESNDFPLFFTFASVHCATSETVFLKDRRDVLYMGAYDNPAICVNAIARGEALYFLRLQEQAEQRLRAINWVVDNKKDADYGGKDVTEIVRDKYAGLLWRARVAGDWALFRIAEIKFKDFCHGSACEKDCGELCEFLRTTVSPIHEYIINRWAEKINAIHHERYEEAAELRNEIRRLLT
ncbi:hypothetical protein HY485_04175 [Candidatus Woesearchaeota archaeon]|nr:hypothetical protein [Candidatus Woesearchaeota archaeon]